MSMQFFASLLAVALVTHVAVAADPTTRPANWQIIRVAGDVAAPEAYEVDDPKEGLVTHFRHGTARVTTALPEDYPAPTPPEAIEVKKYPVVRQAVVSGEGAARGGFWPLFRHISSRDIAMTAPVVMTGDPSDGGEGESSMAFLYRTDDLGPTGDMEDNVVVEDAGDGLFLSLGMQGNRQDAVDVAVARLEAWLDMQEGPAKWQRVEGPARLLGYNGPSVRRDRQWWEVQIPVEWSEE
jgi:hypothetical protein